MILKTLGMLNWTHDLPSKEDRLVFESVLDMIPPFPDILEIGTYTGTSLIAMNDYLLRKNSQANFTVVDIWVNYNEVGLGEKMIENGVEDAFYFNLSLFPRLIPNVTIYKKKSRDILIQFVREQRLFDFIYVDGSHACLDCYLDLELSWSLLKPGGILGIDDFLWSIDSGKVLDIPFEAANHFYREHESELKVISSGYRVFLKKV